MQYQHGTANSSLEMDEQTLAWLKAWSSYYEIERNLHRTSYGKWKWRIKIRIIPNKVAFEEIDDRTIWGGGCEHNDIICATAAWDWKFKFGSRWNKNICELIDGSIVRG